MQKITPFLWFNDDAEEAAKFYVSIFPKSKILRTTRYGDAGPGPKGSVMTVEFELDGERFVALNGGPQFKFTEAISFIVHCKDQDELDEMWDKLLMGGGRPDKCGWLKDRFGLSWQVVPTVLPELLQDQDPVKSKRVMEAVLKMTKLDIEELEEAHASA
ncbi:MAG TPA: VOC family protein [Candidatus Eisenbacteria bacterium]|nr:VOC family protein [Candidatus Eisenbacteria bacterium]